MTKNSNVYSIVELANQALRDFPEFPSRPFEKRIALVAAHLPPDVQIDWDSFAPERWAQFKVAGKTVGFLCEVVPIFVALEPDAPAAVGKINKVCMKVTVPSLDEPVFTEVRDWVEKLDSLGLDEIEQRPLSIKDLWYFTVT